MTESKKQQALISEQSQEAVWCRNNHVTYSLKEKTMCLVGFPEVFLTFPLLRFHTLSRNVFELNKKLLLFLRGLRKDKARQCHHLIPHPGSQPGCSQPQTGGAQETADKRPKSRSFLSETDVSQDQTSTSHTHPELRGEVWTVTVSTRPVSAAPGPPGLVPLCSAGKTKQLGKRAYSPVEASYFWLHPCGVRWLTTRDEAAWRTCRSLPIIQKQTGPSSIQGTRRLPEAAKQTNSQDFG